jgi:HPt (histidine-containing phosphotransfer) domain-containing protein
MVINLFYAIFKPEKTILQTMDLQEINKLTGGDESFKKDLIEIFLKQIDEFIIKMNSYLNDNKMENLAREAHTAKSSVLIFGMVDTGLLLKEIQHLAESNDTATIPSLIKKVEIDLSEAKEVLLNEQKKTDD